MTVAPNPEPSLHEDAFTAVYREHFVLLRRIVVSRFNVPEPAAEELVQDVFISFLRVHETVREPRAWLIGGVCNAARQYWSERMECSDVAQERLLCAASSDIDALAQRLTVRQVVGRLHAKCRRTLQLHYWTGATAREMAETLGTTPRYAEKLIHRCLRKAWSAWRHLWEAP